MSPESLKVTILGSGGSTGVPGVGVGWGRCDPKNPKNRRLRPSIMVQDGATNVLVDTSPDLREQLLRHDIRRLDAVLVTHTHADHIHGIDDIRGINRAMESAIDLYGNEESIADIKRRFGYVLDPVPPKQDGSPPSYFRPVLIPGLVRPGDSITIGSMSVKVIDQDHGFSKTLGFRFNTFAYSTDVKNMRDESFDMLKGVETWVIGAPVTFDHPTHINVDTALKWIEIVKPKRAVISHLGLGLDYETLRRRLPDGVEPAYDGMVLDV